MQAKQQILKTLVSAHDTPNELVVNDDYVEMRSFVKDAVIPDGKADILNTTEVPQSQEPAGILGRDPKFTRTFHNHDQESNNRVYSKLRHSTSWSEFSIYSKDIPQYSDFM